MIVDYTDVKNVNGRNKYRVICRCGHGRYLKNADIKKLSAKLASGQPERCEFCHLKTNRLNNPSGPEYAMMQMLDSLGVEYVREFEVADVENDKTYCVDFFVNGLLIEVDCKAHKENPQWRARDARIAQLWPGQIVRISTRQLKHDTASVWALLTALVQ